jgi:hypothetical protein
MRVALAVPFVVLTARRAGAADTSTDLAALPIELELHDCDALDQAELFKLLAIEFRTLNVQAATPTEHVHVACAPQRAVVTLEAGDTSNEVDLAATAPAVWPRLLALSVSEIVIESRARVVPAAPIAPPEPIAPLTRKLPENIEDDRRFRLFAGGALRRAVRPSTWLSGPELGVAFELNRHFSLVADLRLELGQTSTALANVDWVSASGALVALIGGSMGHWDFGVGPGVRLGYMRLSPQVRVTTATGHSVSGVWSGPELVACTRYALDARWFALGGVDSGVVTAPVTGLVNGEQRLVDTGGAWVSALLGAGVVF